MERYCYWRDIVHSRLIRPTAEYWWSNANAKFQMSNVKCQISKVKCHMLNIKCQIEDTTYR